MRQCAAKYTNKCYKFYAIASASIGWLLHHHFIYTEFEELYLVNSKKLRLYSSIEKALKNTKVQNQKNKNYKNNLQLEKL